VVKWTKPEEWRSRAPCEEAHNQCSVLFAWYSK
jgi:hypothetical protein